jgi:AraC family transcriptional regulator
VSTTLERLQRGIDFMEARLFDDLPLAAVAERGGWSPWHFHRLFVALTGETPAGYVWKRRLSEICRRLVEIALDCGFESQASFTRAFARHVGVAPGRFRRTQVQNVPAYRYPPLDLVTLVERRKRMDVMEARIVQLPAFYVIGMAGRFEPTSARIPELWGRFAPRIDDVPHRVGTHTLGVCLDADPATIETTGLTYVACVEVSATDAIPDGMTSATIPANTYAVLTHRGHVSRLPDTVKHVWGHWLPASGHRHVSAPDFERYDLARWDPSTGDGEIDLYVPIAG